MKRIIPLALICVILAVSLAPAASASEIDDSMFLEILDWCLPNGGNQYIIYGSGSASCYFGTPYVRNILYIDIVCEVNGGSSPVCQFGGDARTYDLNVEHLGDFLYRFYGEVAYYSNVFNLYFTNYGMTYVRFHSVRISYSDLTHYPIEAYCGISTDSFADTIHYVPTDEVNSRRFLAGTEASDLWLTCFIYTEEWKKYDYLEFQLSISCASINSISCIMGPTVIPCEVSFLDNTLWTYTDNYVTIRIDVSQLSKDTDDYPMIILEGQLTPGDYNNISMSNVSGYLSSTNGSMVGYYYRSLVVHLRTWFTNLENALRGNTASGNQFKEDSAGLISGLDDISASMDAVNRPSMDSVNTGFTGDITDATVLMTGLFTEVTSVSWLSTILMASCTLGLIAYILYGKE